MQMYHTYYVARTVCYQVMNAIGSIVRNWPGSCACVKLWIHIGCIQIDMFCRKFNSLNNGKIFFFPSIMHVSPTQASLFLYMINKHIQKFWTPKIHWKLMIDALQVLHGHLLQHKPWLRRIPNTFINFKHGLIKTKTDIMIPKTEPSLYENQRIDSCRYIVWNSSVVSRIEISWFLAIFVLSKSKWALLYHHRTNNVHYFTFVFIKIKWNCKNKTSLIKIFFGQNMTICEQ